MSLRFQLIDTYLIIEFVDKKFIKPDPIIAKVVHIKKVYVQCAERNY